MSRGKKKKKGLKISGDMVFGMIMVVLFFGLMALIILSKDKTEEEPGKVSTENAYASTENVKIEIKDRAYLGREDAPITVVEYGDYKCSHCEQFESSAFVDIEEKLIDTGKVKFVYKNFAFLSEDSVTAAVYAQAVYHTLGNDAFWKFHQRLFEKQRNQYGTGAATTSDIIFDEKTLNGLVKTLFGKKEAEKVSIAYTENIEEYTAQVEADIKEATANGVTGTPSVYLNGKKLANANNVDVMVQLVEEIVNEDTK